MKRTATTLAGAVIATAVSAGAAFGDCTCYVGQTKVHGPERYESYENPRRACPRDAEKKADDSYPNGTKGICKLVYDSGRVQSVPFTVRK